MASSPLSRANEAAQTSAAMLEASVEGEYPPASSHRLLPRRGAVEDQVARRLHHHRVGVKPPEATEPPEAPREQDGKRDLVELDSLPVRLAVDPEILGETAVRVLADGQVDQGPQGRARVSRRQEARGGMDEVARPDEVISPSVVVALHLPPGNRQRGDEGAGVRLVLVGEEEAVAPAIEVPSVVRGLVRGQQVPAHTVPLLRVSLPMLLEGNREGLEERRHGAVEAVAESEPQRELASIAKVQLAGEGDVSVRCPFELPVHPEVGGKVRPAVAPAHVAAGQARERDRSRPARARPRPSRRSGSSCPRSPPRSVVSRPAHTEVRGAQGVEPKPLQERFFPGEDRVHEEAGLMRVGKDLLDEWIAPLRVGVRDPVSEDARGEAFRGGTEMTLLLVEETLAIRDEELEIADLRPVDGGVVDLRDDPVPDR